MVLAEWGGVAVYAAPRQPPPRFAAVVTDRSRQYDATHGSFWVFGHGLASRAERQGLQDQVVAAGHGSTLEGPPPHVSLAGMSRAPAHPMTASADAIASTRAYRELIERLRRRVRESQARAARALNSELVMLYWSIGRDILDQQKTGGLRDQGCRKPLVGAPPQRPDRPEAPPAPGRRAYQLLART